MRFCFLCALVFPVGLAWGAEGTAPSSIEFNRDIRPILSDNCFACHGPDASHRQADLRLDSREAAIDQKAIVPGKPGESSIIARIFSTNKDEVMPPPDAHKTLTPRQKELLSRWIAQGAEYQLHWSYEPPVKGTIPAGQNGIDVLVRQRLAKIGMKPSAEADRRTLIRRLYFDLLGLPPTPEEVATFLNDKSPKAYEDLVDRVLQNPHYGERMAMGWLDVVRFADTIGYHSDNPRNIWPYRDWVIRSFNENKPFDRFTQEQIAGDLLSDANQETQIGSAFNRLLLTTEEGGAQPKDYESRMLTDRVRAIGAAWMGQTTGCAQCHDHKFDPFTTRDFYALGAFFADIKEPIIGRREDGMLIGTPDELSEMKRLENELTAARKKWDAVQPFLNAAQKQWEADVLEYKGVLAELREGSEATSAEKKEASRVIELLKKKELNSKDQQTVKGYFQNRVTKLYRDEKEGLAKAEQNRKKHYDALAKCLVTVSTTSKRTVRILPRGNWLDETGEIVQPSIPKYLSHADFEGRDLTRLDLANWLVSRNNPLTARTVMNRLWKQLFGMGLSKVLDDLGAQGEPPANLALLDWLACEFMESGWDVKHMVRKIVTSATYRQTSSATPEQLSADPENRELARQSTFRVDAELVRDTALFSSGLMVSTIGGPSVKPYQPDGYWENLNFPQRTYDASTDQGQYRRGLYTWWQRSFLHPSMLAFDAPSREECAADRNRSNIPQQALVLLNDPTYVEAARVLAAKVLQEKSGTAEERIDYAWQRVLQRSPRAEELQLIRSLLERHRNAYHDDSAAAEALLKTGLTPIPETLDKAELAAWTHVVRVLLNLHETITRS